MATQILEAVEIELIQLKRLFREYAAVVEDTGTIEFIQKTKLKGAMFKELKERCRE